MPEATPIAHWPKRNESMVHDSIVPAMADTTDTANVIIRPPIAWAVAVLAGLALNWLMLLPFIPAAVPAGELGVMVMSALPPKADIGTQPRNVRFVPKADIGEAIRSPHRQHLIGRVEW